MALHRSSRSRPLVVVLRLFLIVTLLAPHLLLTLSIANAATHPASVQAELAGLRQASDEDTETYLQRVAMAQPELFQQAAMAALQDALNGALPQQPGEQAIEYQIAFYIDQAIQAAMQPSTTWAPPAHSPFSSDSTLGADGSAQRAVGHRGAT
ncbi:hypothetical protein [Candidatus Viridilinea mediisalina]|uniref:hypothetical protein n=1 Tax=Candidatus Viridilinea mediisalina TaxID=2024553 RepID=UPI0013FD8FB4|nr:hypothetical protein [Candidatus Viridilinea mediisalina]